MKITVKKVNGMTRGLVTGITGKTLLNSISRRYSKNWKLPAFTSSLSRGRLLLIKRTRPLSKPIPTWTEWERK